MWPPIRNTAPPTRPSILPSPYQPGRRAVSVSTDQIASAGAWIVRSNRTIFAWVNCASGLVGMEFDSLRTERDDVVRDGAAFDAYRASSELIDSNHPKIQAYARQVAGEGSDREKALRLYYAVRDGLRY